MRVDEGSWLGVLRATSTSLLDILLFLKGGAFMGIFLPFFVLFFNGRVLAQLFFAQGLTLLP
ncbi:hypothetical protein [Vibrio sp. EA2]|uniref:hypothetical protein n=1 Tax=Vibrio sp. EA2 TaxID=3079860 RepID=UPI00294A23CD|nr:hypothetical protein [Vibrio sp. EA2]MDV6252733.1 hypothetical protein [Vibrio sp. EA2]